MNIRVCLKYFVHVCRWYNNFDTILYDFSEPLVLKITNPDNVQKRQFILRILMGKQHPQKNLQLLGKYEFGHLGRWYIRSINFL